MDYKKYRQNWDRLTDAEKQYLILHPWNASKIEENARKALKKAEDIFGKGSLHNGSGDAFRHCYWSALLARDIGKEATKKFTSAHESRPGNPKKEKEMDSYNNDVGIEIGRKKTSCL